METNTNPTQNDNLNNQQPIQPPAQPTPSKMSFFKENKWSIYVIVASLIVLAIGAYFILRKPAQSGPTQPKVSVSIDAPQNTPSGSEIVYKVTVADNDTTSISNISLDLIYPQGFTFEDSTPKPIKLSGTEFSLPAIDPGQNATIMIKGTIQGNADETKTISGLMHYTFGSFSATYVVQAQSQTQIKTADIVLQFDGQPNANNNQDLTYNLSYTNFTDQPIENFKITVTAPKGFNIKSENPQPNFEQTWQLGTLDPNASGKISIVGDFENTNSGDQQLFTAQAEGDSGSGQSFVLSAAQFPVQIQAQALEADINYQGNDSVAPGANVDYEIDYQNNSGKIINGASVSVALSGPFDLQNLNLRNGVINGNIVTWDASQVPDLKTLAVGATGKINLNLVVKNPASRSGQKNLALKAVPSMQSSEFQQAFEGKSSTIKVQTVAQIGASVAYASGATPPKVGQSSAYNVEVDMRNATNDVSNAKVTLNLPSAYNFDLSSVASAERNNVSYDRSTRQLTWNIGTLAANSGSFAPLRRLQFQVTIIPQPSDKDKGVLLINNVEATGTDTFTNLPINLNFRDLSTTDDPSANGSVQQ